MKRLSPVAINALKEALCQVYWYKKDLKTFLRNGLSQSQLSHDGQLGRQQAADRI